MGSMFNWRGSFVRKCEYLVGDSHHGWKKLGMWEFRARSALHTMIYAVLRLVDQVS